MPLNREDLAAACRANDALVDAGGNVTALLAELQVDPMASVYVAEQRALRVAMLHSGVPPHLIATAARHGVPFVPKLHKRQRDLIPIYAGVWTDGLICGVRAYYDALTR